MATHTQWFFCLTLALLLAGSATPPAGAQELADRPAAADRLAKPLDFAIDDAEISAAVEALNETKATVARCEGTMPGRKVALTVTAMPLRDLLDALASLYGVRWEQRTTTIIFCPRVAAAARTEPVEAAPVAPAQGQPVPPALSQANPSNPTLDVLNLLRASGIGRGPEPRGPDAAEQCRIATNLAGIFNPAVQQRMAQAGTEAYRLGIRVADLPPDVCLYVLGWQAKLHREKADSLLWKAVQPFDRQKYLDAVMYLSFAPDADGLPRQVPSLALRGPDWSNSWALAPTK